MKHILKALDNQIRLLTDQVDQLHAYLKDMHYKLEQRDGECEKLHTLAMDYRNRIENLEKSANVTNAQRVNDMQTIAKLQQELDESTRDKTDLANEVQRLRKVVDAHNFGDTIAKVVHNNPGPQIA